MYILPYLINKKEGYEHSSAFLIAIYHLPQTTSSTEEKEEWPV